MENNNISEQQPQTQQPQQILYPQIPTQQPQQQYQQQYQPQYQYQQPQYQQADPHYAVVVKDFLTKAIVSCAISSLPVGSIIAINMATKNRQAIPDYIEKGGLHTDKVKVCSCLSRGGRYSGIGFTIFWGIYLIYFLIMIFAGVAAIIAQR